MLVVYNRLFPSKLKNCKIELLTENIYFHKIEISHFLYKTVIKSAKSIFFLEIENYLFSVKIVRFKFSNHSIVIL